ncbi:jg22098 [Pararge aegeria aegeria]|uniref:Jg22098 protein n=1 Tax=Pararge aegeria aegeria TaxID=348720 RepID=A0A8S4RLK5_9NEOP|nr:jg22098 [Pararge aegeria aegeria]
MWRALKMTGGESESCNGGSATKAGRAEDRALVEETTLKLSQGPLGRGSPPIECSGARFRRLLPADWYPINYNACLLFGFFL